ncbi:MAG: hypothetical protein WCH31_09420 [Actinomycetes bacterium]
MSNQEHPAAKAGRYVRAAGSLLAKKIENLETLPPPKAAQPTQPAPPRAAAPPAAPPKPENTGGIVGFVVFYGFIASLAATVLAVLNIDQLFNGSSVRTIILLSISVVLFAEAFLLTSNWERASQRLAQRLLTRIWGPRAAMNRREKFVSRLARDILTLIGIAWLAVGTFELIRGTIGT